jgi:hypothetical protein
MTVDKPVVEVRARSKRATLAAIIDEQDRQAKDLSRVSRIVENEVMDRLAEISRKVDDLAALEHSIGELRTELAKIVGMVGTIRAINNRADQTLSLLQASAVSVDGVPTASAGTVGAAGSTE